MQRRISEFFEQKMISLLDAAQEVAQQTQHDQTVNISPSTAADGDQHEYAIAADGGDQHEDVSAADSEQHEEEYNPMAAQSTELVGTEATESVVLTIS